MNRSFLYGLKSKITEGRECMSTVQLPGTQRDDAQQHGERTALEVRSPKCAKIHSVPGGALSAIRRVNTPIPPLAPHPVAGVITPPDCLTPCTGSPLATYDVVVALDSEWVATHELHNLILCYQWTALYQSGAHQWCLSEGLHFPEVGERLT